METPNEILTELQEIAPSLGRNLIPVPYQVHQDYFPRFSEELMNRIRKTDVHRDKDANEEINDISPLLAGLKNKNPYQVPVGYFENLQTKIPENEILPPRVVEMPLRKVSAFTRTTRRLAIAASVVAVLGTAMYQFAFRHGKIQADPLSALAAVSDQDMANYLDSDDIHWMPSVSSLTALADFNESDIHDLLSSVSDSELEQYLPGSDEKGTVN